MYSVYASLAYETPEDIAKLYNGHDDGTRNCKAVKACVEPPQFVSNEQTHTQAFIFKTATETICACRGTDDLYDCFDDLDAILVPLQLKGYPVCRVHQGFLRQARGLITQIQSVVDAIHPNQHTLVFTGHSLGSVICVIAAAIISAESITEVHVHGYGCPKPGDVDFKANFNKLVSHVELVKWGSDPVTKVMIGNQYQHVTDLTHYGPIDFHPNTPMLNRVVDHDIINYIDAESKMTPTTKTWWQQLAVHATSFIHIWLDGL